MKDFGDVHPRFASPLSSGIETFLPGFLVEVLFCRVSLRFFQSTPSPFASQWVIVMMSAAGKHQKFGRWSKKFFPKKRS